MFLFLSLQAYAQENGSKAENEIIEGIHYTVITPKKKIVSAPAGKIVVQEFFWYGCPHCYSLEPYIKKWEKPADVHFERLPAVLGKHWATHAYIYYALEALGKIDEAHERFFSAIHKEKLNLKTMAQTADFFANFGIQKMDLEKAMKSFLVDAKVKAANQLAQSYQITGVPVFIINGHYKTSPSMVGSYKGFIEVVKYLIDKERK